MIGGFFIGAVSEGVILNDALTCPRLSNLLHSFHEQGNLIVQHFDEAASGFERNRSSGFVAHLDAITFFVKIAVFCSGGDDGNRARIQRGNNWGVVLQHLKLPQASGHFHRFDSSVEDFFFRC